MRTKVLFKHFDRQGSERKAMNLWLKLGEDYRTKVGRYRDLYDIKKAKNIRPLRKVSEEIIREYPSIPFLKIIEQKDAESFIKNLPDHELEPLIKEIEAMVETNCAFRTLTARIADFEKQIERHSRGKYYSTYMSIDPDRVIPSTGRRSSTGKKYE